MNMLFVLSNTFDPYFHLSAEEYLLKNKTEDIFMLWRSQPAVICGKHQNILSEINYRYIRENNILPARRLSGGGTVVHDLNNLNFTFIANGEEGRLIDFKKFVSPVIDYLATLNVEAVIGAKNDILISGLKISGNAEHVYRKRVLHHGTLLFNSNLEQLRNALKISKGRYIDKAVQSNRSSVTNILEYLDKSVHLDDFTLGLRNFIFRNSSDFSEYRFSHEELDHINKLRDTKYASPDWIFGYSPRYLFKNEFTFSGNQWKVELECEQGTIKSACILINEQSQAISEKILMGQAHLFQTVCNSLSKAYSQMDETSLTELSYRFF